ncbi:MAG TPA: DUF2723 domain-containing protein [Candidatus Limnocylindria bacterium]
MRTNWRLIGAGGVAVLACALALRLPFGAAYLWAWDSVLYARAIDDFAVDLGRPHPPGYLLYVLVARVAAFVLGDANAGLVLVSVVSGALTCAVGFVVAARLVGPVGGVLTAAALIVNPLLWQYSEIAYPYATLALLAGGIGALVWTTRARGAWPIVASAAFGIAAGFRQDLLLLLGPLWLYVVIRQRPRVALASTAAAAVACFVWLIPTAAESGGLVRYVGAVLAQAEGVSALGDAGLDSFAQNAQLTFVGLRWQAPWTWPLVLAGLWVVGRSTRGRLPRAALALWVGPSLAVYLLFHTGEWAYTLSLAVPLALLAGAGGAWLLRWSGRSRPVAAVLVALLLVLNAESFIFGGGRFSLHEIARHDAILAAQIDYVRAHFAAADTVIVAQGNYQHATYYLGEYPAVYVQEIAEPQRLIGATGRSRWVVLFGDEVRLEQRARVTRMVLQPDVDLRVVRLRPGERVVCNGGAQISLLETE